MANARAGYSGARRPYYIALAGRAVNPNHPKWEFLKPHKRLHQK
jgi:hypothetical protein